jgi:spore maturation protein CgeB
VKGSVSTGERAELYERLARAEQHISELEAEIEWRRAEQRRESERASSALARAAEALDALTQHRAEVAEDIEAVVARIGAALPSGLTVRGAEGVEPVPAAPSGPELVGLPLAVREAASRSDARVALEAGKALAERGGTQTLGPFVPSIPLPTGPIVRPDLRIACVMDQFSRLAFQYEFDYVDLPAQGWEQELEERPPRALIVESAWRGAGDQWQHRVARSSRAHDDLIVLVDWCRQRDIPTVFWNKEDPPNFDFFKLSARLFDYVFTTDADCIPRYLEVLDHDRVDVLPFAAQPRIHNPIRVAGSRGRSVAFAGTYYAAKHPNRKVQMEAVVDPAREFGLEIFSRVTNHPKYEFPEKYRSHIVGTLTYPDVLTAHKMYRLFLNVNSVVGSATMCARRIFELLAAGTGIVSGVSPAIVSQVGGGLVTEAAHPDETREALSLMLDDEDARARIAVRGLRRIMSDHTYGDRTETILRAIGLASAAAVSPTLTVVACLDRPEDACRLLESLRRQRGARRPAPRPRWLALVAGRLRVVARPRGPRRRVRGSLLTAALPSGGRSLGVGVRSARLLRAGLPQGRGRRLPLFGCRRRR